MNQIWLIFAFVIFAIWFCSYNQESYIRPPGHCNAECRVIDGGKDIGGIHGHINKFLCTVDKEGHTCMHAAKTYDLLSQDKTQSQFIVRCPHANMPNSTVCTCSEGKCTWSPIIPHIPINR